MKFYGEIRYADPIKKFGIKCEPHISMRLKRVFGKISASSFDTHRIHASKENARDLAWFIERYPMEMDDETRDKLYELRDEHMAIEKYVHEFYTQSDAQKLEFDLAIPARDYQKLAADFLFKTEAYLLGDDVGLGKTVSFITALTKPVMLPALVVTLSGAMPRQWEEEIHKFAPQLSTHVAKKGTPSYKFEIPDVMIMNYHKLAGWAETLRPIIRSVCFDEPQELRHSGTHKYNAARHVRGGASFCMGTSATPIYNYGGEAYTVLNAIAPGRLGTQEEFQREWCTTKWGKVVLENPQAFGKYLRDAGLMLRRTRSEVGRELPPVSKFHQIVDTDAVALEKVSDSCAELARIILRGKDHTKGETMRAGGQLDNILRQATGIAKAPHVANFTKMLLDGGEKVVVFGWHRAVYDIWNDILRDYKPVMYTGSESPRQKEFAKLAFIQGDSQVFFISLRAGAGLDGLQHVCRTLVIGELDWSPGVIEQNIGRLDRDGQPDPVMAYFMLSDEGSDPPMMDVLGIKKGQVEGIRNHDAPLFEKIQIDTDHIKKLAASFLGQNTPGIDSHAGCLVDPQGRIIENEAYRKLLKQTKHESLEFVGGYLCDSDGKVVATANYENLLTK